MIGNRKMMEDNQVAVSESVDAKLSEFEKEGKTAVLVAIDDTLSGIISYIRHHKRKCQGCSSSFESQRD